MALNPDLLSFVEESKGDPYVSLSQLQQHPTASEADVKFLGNSRRGYASVVTIKHRELMDSLEPDVFVSIEHSQNIFDALRTAFSQFESSHKKYVEAAKSVNPNVDLLRVEASYSRLKEAVEQAKYDFTSFSVAHIHTTSTPKAHRDVHNKSVESSETGTHDRKSEVESELQDEDKATLLTQISHLIDKQRVELTEMLIDQQQRVVEKSIDKLRDEFQKQLQATRDILSDRIDNTLGTATGAVADSRLDPNVPSFVPKTPQQVSVDSTLQNRILVDSLQLPKIDMMSFDGDPLKYWQFVNTFNACIGDTLVSDGAKLARLLAYCTGTALKVIQPCALMEPTAGYRQALYLLRQRFGDDFVIAQAWVKHIVAGGPLKGGNSKSLQSFSDDLSACVQTLTAMGHVDEIETRDRMAIIVERLPGYLRSRWQRLAVEKRDKTGRYPDMIELCEFVKKAAREANDPVFGTKPESKPARTFVTGGPSPNPPTSRLSSDLTSAGSANDSHVLHVGNTASAGKPCRWCGDNSHQVAHCNVVKRLSLKERYKHAREKRLCFNCLFPGHSRKDCRQKKYCSVSDCTDKYKHNTWLHGAILFPRGEGPADNPPVVDDSKGASGNPSAVGDSKSASGNRAKGKTFSGCTASETSISLPVVEIFVRGVGQTEFIRARALLDSGSNRSFCCKDLAEQLGIKGKDSNLNITTLGGTQSATSSCLELEATSIVGPKSERTLVSLPEVYALDEFPTVVAARQSDIRKWEHLAELSPYFASVDEVSLLIGQDVPHALLPVETRVGEAGTPYAIRTVLGWTINGPLSKPEERVVPTSFLNVSSFHISLDAQVEQFWKLDIGPVLAGCDTQMSVDDQSVVKRWTDSSYQLDGHYCVDIPFKVEPPSLPNNYSLAKRRLITLNRRLKRDAELCKRYQEEIETLLAKGYAERVPFDEYSGIPGYTWYLPHHCVLNPNKPEKVRVVFDCAAEFHGTSLNARVLQGPDLACKLLGVLIRFCEKPIAIMADVEAMFHQVYVTPGQRDALRFLWWEDVQDVDEPVILRFKVHPFGGVWSPSAANFALRRTALDRQCEYESEAGTAVLENFYVDDLLKSCDSVESAVRLVDHLRRMLAAGGFHLTKWVSNSRQVVESIETCELAKGVRDLDLDQNTLPVERALGVQWNLEADCFQIRRTPKAKPHTRRGLLSVTSSVFDPLGMVSPCVLNAKRLFQEECRLEKSWDDPLEPSTCASWLSWLEDLPRLDEVSIPRCYIPEGFTVGHLEVHHFCDASQYAYGTVSYLRVIGACGNIHCAFILGKSRLAPLKTMTIPRLELSAAVLAVRVNAIISSELRMSVDQTFYWSDSMVVLQYIRSRVRRFNTFVANRLAVIHDGSDVTQWRYVDSASNPADDASRGLRASDLVESPRWFAGPQFLQKDPLFWPAEPSNMHEVSSDDPEVKGEANVCTIVSEKSSIDEFITRYSCWHRLVKALCWLRRFVRWVVGGRTTVSAQPVSVTEMDESRESIILYVQRQRYSEEFKSLGLSKAVSKSSDLRELDPFVDSAGLLRVGGRLRESPIADSSKHPVLIPREHHVATLIVRQTHEKECAHSGREHVLSRIRERYWIPRARRLIDQVLNRCIICRRVKGRFSSQRMADLPCDRVTPNQVPFLQVGIDCFGHFLVKRGRSLVKRYGCIFTCLAVRAIHIEVLDSLEADSFLNALARFSARRGKPEVIRCDNATNFTRGAKELRMALEDWNKSQRLQECMLQKHIEWKFNPPTASHMGGVWERQIRTIRKVINSILKGVTLTDEELTTLMCEVEATINSRPISPVSSKVDDLEPLTPNHLLLLRTGPSLPPGKFVKGDMYSRRWRHVQFLSDMFWKRWVREYLPTLQARSKWSSRENNLKPGDLVLVQDDMSARRFWPLGRVIESHTGRDGCVRSVKVKTATNVLVRPITKLCLLESIDEY